VRKLTITAAALAAGLLLQTQGFTQAPISASTANHAGTTSDPEKEARKTWHAVMKNIPVPGKGCFHASYPNVVWESVDCKEAKPGVHPVHVKPAVGVPQEVGAVGSDYTAWTQQGLISVASGSFQTSGITTETGVGGDTNAKDGPNEYSLQINTNQGYTDRCAGHPSCYVWQQFVYSTDTFQDGEGALYIQYWLVGWDDTCPKDWSTVTYPGGTVFCWKNSKHVSPPDIPVTNLGELVLTGSAVPGGDDYVELEYTDDIWSISAEDEVLGIGYVWNQAEFNVFGNGGGSQAQFNQGTSITVLLALRDGSTSAPTCRGGDTGAFPFNEPGTTAESNNLNLGTCQAGYFLSPYIQFTENWPFPPDPCVACGPVVPGPPPPIEP
jgi:hypothetical protein